MKKEKRLNKKQKAGIITLAFALIIAVTIIDLENKVEKDKRRILN